MSDELSQLRKQRERLTTLYQVSNVIHSSLDPQNAACLGLVSGPGKCHHLVNVYREKIARLLAAIPGISVGHA